ncbi:MAG: alginate export family protein [Algibacter sp.]|uniref:alginate export family protein n=1 Tax=Algibacter sp. TaxID=1872428 RepID=UPI002633ED17|nr:alginate export family protein [Algibacter sp.]MDG1729713.1 alginate export family protein [Algibacter sp.]MDG2179130.1 alginate export family protein [Algibacter sp.]
MKKQYILIGLMALIVQFAQAQFKLDGEFRPRTEYFGNGGNFTGGSFPAQTATDADEGFMRTTVRAAIKATYTAETYTVFTSFQEVFAFGDRPQIATNGNGNFRVQEAWANLKLGEFSSLKLGRQPLSYDDQRILGGLGWAQQARTHDAAVYKFKKGSYSLDIGGALNTTLDEVYNTSALFSYRDMVFLRANTKGEKLNISFLGLINTFQDSGVDGSNKSSLITAGLHADYKLGDLSLTSNLFIQEGERLGGVDVKGAFLASLGAVYKLNGPNSIGLTYEVISGRNSDSAAFFPLYGTNHAFNGLIDRFYVGNHGNAGGLKDLQLTYKTKVSGVAVTVAGHYFTEHSDFNAFESKDLGTEIDLVLAKKFKEFTLVGGYSHFFEPSDISDIPGVKGTQNWAWAMLVIQPKFLNTAK